MRGGTERGARGQSYEVEQPKAPDRGWTSTALVFCTTTSNSSSSSDLHMPAGLERTRCTAPRTQSCCHTSAVRATTAPTSEERPSAPSAALDERRDGEGQPRRRVRATASGEKTRGGGFRGISTHGWLSTRGEFCSTRQHHPMKTWMDASPSTGREGYPSAAHGKSCFYPRDGARGGVNVGFGPRVSGAIHTTHHS